MATKTSIIFLTITLSLFFIICSATLSPQLRHVRRPCKKITVYYHDILYNGSNRENATSAIVGEPAWGNKTSLTEGTYFGDFIAIDGPITADKSLHSPPVGRAQGLYLYTANKSPLSSWHAFSLVFNSTKYKGTLNVAGLNMILYSTRDLPVFGGTGEFFMHRGIVTCKTDAVEDHIYFRLRMEIKLYECWRLADN